MRMHLLVATVGAWLPRLMSAVERPLSSWIDTVPPAKLFPLFVVVEVNADQVPKPPRLPSTPRINIVSRTLRFLLPIPVLSASANHRSPRVTGRHPHWVGRLAWPGWSPPPE